MQTIKILGTTAAVIISFTTYCVGAQGLVEAMQSPVPFDPPYSSGIVGYQDDGTAGWSFTPAQMIKVDTLGCVLGNTFMTAGVQVGLWKADGTLLASTIIYTNSPQINTSQYEPITPVFLNAGSTYFIAGCAATNNWTFCGAGDPAMAPQVGFNGYAYSAANAGFAFPTNDATGSAGQFAMVANFEFESAPELSIQSTNTNSVVVSWLAGWTGFVLQENIDPATTNWITNTNTVNVMGNQNQVIISSSSGSRFYRLKGGGS